MTTIEVRIEGEPGLYMFTLPARKTGAKVVSILLEMGKTLVVRKIDGGE